MRLILSLLLIGFALSACMAPQYKNHRMSEPVNTQQMDPLDVNYQLSQHFYKEMPRCVIVFETKSEKVNPWGDEMARALARHLGEKVDQVMFPRTQRRLVKKLGLDLGEARDRTTLATHSRCHFYALAEVYDLGDDYALMFSRKHVGVRLLLKKASNDQVIWQAAHTVWRADGAVPLSPIGAIGGIAKAAYFNQDEEVMPALIDQAMRRMLATLPVS